MDIVIKGDDKETLPVQHKFGKLMIGTAAGFLMTALAEHGYETFVKARMNKKTETKVL